MIAMVQRFLRAPSRKDDAGDAGTAQRRLDFLCKFLIPVAIVAGVVGMVILSN